MGKTAKKSAIMDLYAAYADGVFRHDGAAWIACWEEEAVWQIHDHTLTGTTDIRAMWDTAMAAYAQVNFFFQIGQLDITGKRAAAKVYTVEFIRTLSGETRTQLGEYDDELVRRDRRWRFARRRFHLRDRH